MEEHAGRPRHPWGVIGLCVVTLGVYLFVWFYRVNRELQAVSKMDWPVGWWTAGIAVPVLGLVSLYKMAQSVDAAQKAKRVNGPETLGTFFLLAIPGINLVGIPMVQAQINRVWSKSNPRTR